MVFELTVIPAKLVPAQAESGGIQERLISLSPRSIKKMIPHIVILERSEGSLIPDAIGAMETLATFVAKDSSLCSE